MLQVPIKYISALNKDAIHLLALVCIIFLQPICSYGQQSLICKTSVQISVNDNCEAKINADLLLKNFDPYVHYDIELKQANGVNINGLILGLDHLGQEITATIRHSKTMLSCWSKILVESKIFPEFEGCKDIMISCHAYPDTLQYMSQPDISGPQCGTYTMEFEDRVEEKLCSIDGFSQIVFRQWTLRNESNFEFNCTQRILVKRPSIDDIYFPPHFNNEDYKSISCDYILHENDSISYDHSMEFITDGVPSIKDFPYGTGTPGGQFCGNIKVNFNDTYYPSCGNQMKILRKWHIIDWCTDREQVKDQIIEVLDDRGPILQYESKYRKIDVDYESCLATINSVPFPIEVHDCSQTTFSVSYKYMKDNEKMSAEINKNIITNSEGDYKIENIPSDSVMIIYHVYDDCGHYSSCEIPFSLVDNKSPIAICEQSTIMTLNESGHTELWASKLQHRSVDNCGIVYQEIKRKNHSCIGYEDDLEFGEKINFCCADIGDTSYDITLRVFDAHGNFADCHTEITVQDKIKPLIKECVEHKVIHCQVDYHDMELMGGEPDVYDNCGMSIEYTDDISSLNSCGFGKVYRHWKATDSHGNWSDCMQEITIKSESLNYLDDIIWPRAKTLQDCIHSNISSEVLGEPQLPYQECAHISFNYEDQVFYEQTESCMKILRNWTVIDWCKYDPGTELSNGFWTHTQVIKLSDASKPILQNGCENIVAIIPQDSCVAEINFKMLAIDDCPIDHLKYHQTIFVENGELIEVEGEQLSQQLTAGIHHVLFSVSDGCGNKDECEFNIEVLKENSLQLICLKDVSLSLGATGETEIWASDFIKDVKLNCYNSAEINYSFSLDSIQTSLLLSCHNFDKYEGSQSIQELKVYALDENGNSGLCTIDVTISDNFNLCIEENKTSAMISGHVSLENNVAISNIMVTLYNMSQNITTQQMTSKLGEYLFETELHQDYNINLDATGQILEGVSTLDLILIQKHILDQTSLGSPYKLIAADIDQSKSISVTDLISLRKLILGIDKGLTNGNVWTFINSDFVFFDSSQPWEYPKENYITQLSKDGTNKDFVAVKLGDVNLSYSPFSEQRSINHTELHYEVKKINENFVKCIVKTSLEKDIIGLQLSLNIDSEEFKFVDMQDEYGSSISSNNYFLNKDNLVISYTKENLDEFSDNVEIFSILFEMESQMLNKFELNLNTEFRNELYSNELDILNVIELAKDVKRHQHIRISGIYPNPILTETNVLIHSSVSTPTKIRIYDNLGKDIYSNSFMAKGGYESVLITLPNNLKSGILFCRVENDQDYDVVQLFKTVK